MSSLIRMLRLAELYFQTHDEKSFKQICAQFNSYIKRHAHMEPKQDKNQPNPWKHNMDYAGYENSPYYGSVSEFLEKFPGGIKEWVVWREKTKGERNSMYDILDKLKVKKAGIDFEDLTEEEEEYQPTEEEILESEKPPTAQEIITSNQMVEKVLEELLGDGVVSEEDVEEWRKSQPLKIEQHKADDKDELREELADLEHEQWASWTKYMLDNLNDENSDRWTHQVKTDYKDLSEKEKDSDREWADKVLKIVKKHKGVDKKAHYEPVGGDDVDKFEKEQPLYSDMGLERFKSIKDFLKQYRGEGQSADDAALKAVKDMVGYWKLLLKGKKFRKRKGKK